MTLTPTPTGEALADAGAAAALTSRAAAVWRTGAQAAIKALADRGEPFDADDVTELAGEPPSPGAMGGLFRANRWRLVPVGYTKSARPVGHARVMRIWRGRPASDSGELQTPAHDRTPPRMAVAPPGDGRQPETQLAVALILAEAAISRVRDLHAPAPRPPGYARTYCSGCWTPYPCATLTALDGAS